MSALFGLGNDSGDTLRRFYQSCMMEAMAILLFWENNDGSGTPLVGLQSAVKGLKAKEMLDERMPMPLACNLCYSKDIYKIFYDTNTLKACTLKAVICVKNNSPFYHCGTWGRDGRSLASRGTIPAFGG